MKRIEWKVFSYYGRGVGDQTRFGCAHFSTKHDSLASAQAAVIAAMALPEVGVVRIERVEQ